MPLWGTVNLHASLIPQYRGSEPINWAIINGEQETGVTTFFLNHEIDKGDIIEQQRCAIDSEDNVGTLYERLMTMGRGLVLQTVERIAKGDVMPLEQSQVAEQELRIAPKIFKEDCQVNWSWSGQRIVNFVRGLSPYPATWSSLVRGDEQTTAKIFRVRFEPKELNTEVGSVTSDGLTYLKVACSDGWVSIKEVQLAGKKRMCIKDLLLGLRDVEEYKFG